jgi:hypothetical protein
MTGGLDFPFAGIAERLLSATSLTTSARPGRFDNFGAAIGVRPSNVSALREAMEMVSENVEFGVDEARRRLKSFLTNKRAFKAFDDFTSFLSDKLMRIETRTYGDGRSANYLVDQVSRKAVPAAQVDRRLSREGVKKIFGSTIEDEAMRRATTAGRDPNAATALAIRAKLAPLLGSQKTLPFNGWSELDFTLRSAVDDSRYTVQGGKGWIGKEYAVASSDPQENLSILARARAEGLKLVMPAATAADAREGKLAPGMPILIRAASAQASMVHHRLSHETLERAFGESLPDFRAGQIRKLHGRSGFDTNVVSITRVRTDDFLQQFMRRDDAPKEALERPGAFGGVVAPTAANVIIRRTLADDGREHLAVRDVDADAEISVGLRSLPANLYRKEDGYGIPVGWIRVDDEGAIHHFDNKMRLHNEHGPACDPAPGSRRAPSWSLAGREMSPAEFRQAIFAHEEPKPAPQRLRRAAAGRAPSVVGMSA